jgi:hypothetical protein
MNWLGVFLELVLQAFFISLGKSDGEVSLFLPLKPSRNSPWHDRLVYKLLRIAFGLSIIAMILLFMYWILVLSFWELNSTDELDVVVFLVLFTLLPLLGIAFDVAVVIWARKPRSMVGAAGMIVSSTLLAWMFLTGLPTSSNRPPYDFIIWLLIFSISAVWFVLSGWIDESLQASTRPQKRRYYKLKEPAFLHPKK